MQTISASRFWLCCGIAFLILIALNVAVPLQARKLAPQQLIGRIETNAGAVTDILLGDSQMEADVDALAFTEACRRIDPPRVAMNIGLGGTKASEHCLLLEHLLPRAPAAKAIIYGFYDDLLTSPVPARLEDLGGNRSISFMFPARAGALLFPEDAAARLRLRAAAKIPMFVERLAIWARVEHVRRMLGGWGLPPVASSRFGRVADFDATAIADPVALEANLLAAVRENRPFNHSVEQILARAAERQLNFHLVLMPVPESHRQLFYDRAAWREYREYVRARIERGGGRFIDASNWVADEYFVDPLHLGLDGARVFGVKLAETTCAPTQAQPAR